MPGPKILCVDDTNDGRGVFVHAYLELLRVWYANCSDERRWMFSDISSAGLYIENSFTKANKKLLKKSLITPRQEDRTNRSLHVLQKSKAQDSSEKRAILARIGTRELRGITCEDFQSKDMIVCFQKETMEVLRQLRAEAIRTTHDLQHAKIYYIPLGKGWEFDTVAFNEARKSVRRWAEKYLGFREPDALIREGPYRTAQVFINEYEWWAMAKDNGKMLYRIEDRTRVQIHFGRASNGKIASIVGRPDRIEVAKRMILEVF